VPRYFSVLLAAILALSLVACGDDDNGSATPTPAPAAQADATPEKELSDPITVVATTAQIGALVEEIAGDGVVLHVLMGAGVDPHDYDPTPGDMRTLGDADLILKNGIGLDDFLDSSIEAAGGDADVFTVTEGIALVEGGHSHGHGHDDDDDHGHRHDDDDDHHHDDDDDHGHAHDDDDDHGHRHDDDDDHHHDDDDDHGHAHDDDDDHGHGHDHGDDHHHDDDDDHGHAHDDDDDHGHGHDHGEFDPHVWHDPANAMIMVDNIVAALSEADSSRADLFRENGDAYKIVLEETDAEIRVMFEDIPAENRKLVTTHDAFGYFIQAYDFEFIGAVIPSVSTDAEPSARDIAALSDLIESENVKAIFAEQTVDPRIAEQLARDTGVEIIYGLHSDSLGEPGSGADTIHGMLLANAEKISEALK
jgi:zinc/manganese transport system substrate-binding protein